MACGSHFINVSYHKLTYLLIQHNCEVVDFFIVLYNAPLMHLRKGNKVLKSSSG